MLEPVEHCAAKAPAIYSRKNQLTEAYPKIVVPAELGVKVFCPE